MAVFFEDGTYLPTPTAWERELVRLQMEIMQKVLAAWEWPEPDVVVEADG